jgi:hypothetical protein
MPADDARSEGFFAEKAVTKGRVRCFSTWSEQRAKAERLQVARGALACDELRTTLPKIYFSGRE